MMGRTVVFTGMSGVKPRKVLERLKQKTGLSLGIIDLDDLLVREARNDEFCAASADFAVFLETQHPIIAVTSLPHSSLRRIWGKMIIRATEEIAAAQESNEHVAVVLHAVYFKPDSTEFVHVADGTSLRKLNPSCIVHLIDDIYDIYAWLSEPGQIYDTRSPGRTPFQQAQYAIRNIRDALIWRQAEGGASEHLAAAVNVPLWTVATKHRAGLLRSVIEGDATAAYLSHPISEPRRSLRAGINHTWNECTARVSALAGHISQSLAVWEPTTIDEFRIEKVEVASPDNQSLETSSSERKMEVYLPRLLERWPVGSIDATLWTTPVGDRNCPLDPAEFLTEDEVKVIRAANTWNEIETRLEKEKAVHLHSISGQLEQLTNLISQQVNARDRTLVSQCPIIIAYRPLFNGNDATGVLRELQAHALRSMLRHYKVTPQAFALENSDDERLVWQKAIANLLTPPRGAWNWFISDEQGRPIGREDIQRISGKVLSSVEGLNALEFVRAMESTAHCERFRWGPESQSTLDGAYSHDAWSEFRLARERDLQAEIRARTAYQFELRKECADRRVVCFKDIEVSEFADRVIKTIQSSSENAGVNA